MLHPLVAFSSMIVASCIGLDDPPPPLPQPTASPRATILVVLGVPGSDEYASANATAVSRWREAAARSGAEFLSIGESSPPPKPAQPADRDQLRDQLARHATRATNDLPGPLWLVLLGHGTFDGREAKFNLRGPDITDAELAQWLKPITGPVAILDCTSASAPFLNKLAGSDRIVVTATKSGAEQNYARFGQYLAEVWTDPGTDLDKDGQTSLLEGFLVAARRTGEFYKGKARLSTEHALIDDNADGRGTPADWFEGIRLKQRPKEGAAPDGRRAHQLHLIRDDRDQLATPQQLQRRNDLELRAAALQDNKATLDESEYYTQLEAIMVELARTYDGSGLRTKPEDRPKP